MYLISKFPSKGLKSYSSLREALQKSDGEYLYTDCGVYNIEKILRKFARRAALINIEKVKPYCSTADYKTIIKWLETGDEQYRSAAKSAAWSAWSAAGSAAESAARFAAESAARSAKSAARSAKSAAWSAAWTAARSAVWSTESAARFASESAAWSAAWLASGSSAWLATWQELEKIFIEELECVV